MAALALGLLVGLWVGWKAGCWWGQIRTAMAFKREEDRNDRA